MSITNCPGTDVTKHFFPDTKLSHRNINTRPAGCWIAYVLVAHCRAWAYVACRWNRHSVSQATKRSEPFLIIPGSRPGLRVHVDRERQVPGKPACATSAPFPSSIAE